MAAEDRWIVGLDLQPASRGAVEFAAWLSATGRDAGKLIGIHVLEEAYLRAVLKYHHLAEIEKKAEEAARKEIDGIGAQEQFLGVHILEGSTAERQLDNAAGYHNARGLIIGRQAPKKGRHVLRLGRVARRTLRSLRLPTIVVPPDHDPAHTAGPVICSCNLRSDCLPGIELGIEMAKSLGREAVLVHVVPLPEDYAAHYLPVKVLDDLREEHLVGGGKALRRWAKEHKLDGVECVIEQGGVVERLIGIAKERSACLLSTGSRRLSVYERLLLTSIGSELAATAPCPVAVVPPPPSAL
jgi:nucleotide-binding universal stress UspA family protein